MRQLAGQVGVQPAALYRYFPTKEELLYALMREHMEKLIVSWGEARPADWLRLTGKARRTPRCISLKTTSAFTWPVATPRM